MEKLADAEYFRHGEEYSAVKNGKYKDFIVEKGNDMKKENGGNFIIAVAGTGYVGLSIAVLLSQHNQVYAVDIVEEKVNLINQKKSPIVDQEITEFLSSKELNLKATMDGDTAYRKADIVDRRVY